MRYSYDCDGLVLSTANATTPAVHVLTLTRSALDGHVEQDVLGVVQTQYVVDVSAATPGYGDYQGSTVRVNGTPVYQSAYQHDALGRITEWAETVDGASRVQRFEYDDGGRLVSVRDELDAPVADYGYDLNGNRTHVVEPGRVLDLGVDCSQPSCRHHTFDEDALGVWEGGSCAYYRDTSSFCRSCRLGASLRSLLPSARNLLMPTEPRYWHSVSRSGTSSHGLDGDGSCGSNAKN